MRRSLDLCGGLGGFSEAFMNCPGWEVMRIENNPLLSEVPNTSIIDIFEFRDTLLEMMERGFEPARPDLILASPPCLEFSRAFNAPRSIAQREGRLNEYKPDMSILECVLEIIDILKPQYYLIENVQGSREYFEPYLGEPICVHGAFYFYGRFPPFSVDEKIPSKQAHDKWSSHPLRANYRALIPLCISKAIKETIESQTTLFNF